MPNVPCWPHLVVIQPILFWVHSLSQRFWHHASWHPADRSNREDGIFRMNVLLYQNCYRPCHEGGTASWTSYSVFICFHPSCLSESWSFFHWPFFREPTAHHQAMTSDRCVLRSVLAADADVHYHFYNTFITYHTHQTYESHNIRNILHVMIPNEFSCSLVWTVIWWSIWNHDIILYDEYASA